MRCLIYSSFALLLAASAFAASPTLDPSGGFQGGAGHTVTGGSIANVATTNSNAIVVAVIGNNDSTIAAPKTIQSISFASLTFHQRAINDVTGCFSTSNCGVAAEVWWAYAPSPIAATTFTWTWNGTTDCGTAVVFGVDGVNSFVAPWDTNVVLPSYAHDLTGSNTTASTVISTTEPLDMLLGICSNLGTTCASTPPTGWSSAGFASGPPCAGFNSTTSVFYKAVSSPQTSLNQTLSTSTSYFVTIGDALTASAAPGGNGLQFQTPVSYPGDRRNLKWQ